MQIIEGGVTAAKGFKAAGMAAGIKYKNGKKDMAMVVSDKPCVTTGTFTLNRVFAAPVKWDKNIVYNEAYAQAIVVNSGVANACTGVEGDEACALEAKTAGEALGISADAVLLVQQVLLECSFLWIECVQELRHFRNFLIILKRLEHLPQRQL